MISFAAQLVKKIKEDKKKVEVFTSALPARKDFAEEQDRPRRKRAPRAGEWTDDEIDTLVSIASEKTAPECAEIIGRSARAISIKASRLGLHFKKSTYFDRRFDRGRLYDGVISTAERHRRHVWSINDDICLAKYYNIVNEPLVAAALGVTRVAARSHFHRIAKSRRTMLREAPERFSNTFHDRVTAYCITHGLALPHDNITSYPEDL